MVLFAFKAWREHDNTSGDHACEHALLGTNTLVCLHRCLIVIKDVYPCPSRRYLLSPVTAKASVGQRGRNAAESRDTLLVVAGQATCVWAVFSHSHHDRALLLCLSKGSRFHLNSATPLTRWPEAPASAKGVDLICNVCQTRSVNTRPDCHSRGIHWQQVLLCFHKVATCWVCPKPLLLSSEHSQPTSTQA